MDYGVYSLQKYTTLLQHFKGITNVLWQKFRWLEDRGFDPSSGFIFGFSFGAHVALQAAIQFGPQRIAAIDGMLNDLLLKLF
jgi:dienelactone hydrolase